MSNIQVPAQNQCNKWQHCCQQYYCALAQPDNHQKPLFVTKDTTVGFLHFFFILLPTTLYQETLAQASSQPPSQWFWCWQLCCQTNGWKAFQMYCCCYSSSNNNKILNEQHQLKQHSMTFTNNLHEKTLPIQQTLYGWK